MPKKNKSKRSSYAQYLQKQPKEQGNNLDTKKRDSFNKMILLNGVNLHHKGTFAHQGFQDRKRI